MKIVKLELENKSRFHFGKGVSDISNNFSSDRLFSALINNYAKLYPNSIEEVINFFQEGKIKISSLFYGLEFKSEKSNIKNKTHYFCLNLN